MTLLIHEATTARKAIAFTFDDGPDPLYTPQLLDIFRETGGKATFFVVGEQIKANPQVAEAVHAAGHELGNHTYSHPYLTQLSGEQRETELQQTEDWIVKVTGAKPRTFRPPYLDFNIEVQELVHSMGYAVIGANNTAAEDWREPGVEHILSETRKSVKSGSIFLFHDGYGNRSQTVEAVRVLVAELQAEGYELVTVSELLGLGE